MRIRSFLSPLCWATLCWVVVSFSTHASTLSFSARLVNSDGSPVAGPVELLFELAYSNNTTDILCSKSVPDVGLSSGVFHANLKFTSNDCLNNKELVEVLQETPPNESLMMRVSDETDGANIKTYPFQALNTVPMSVMSQTSKTLSQMGAESGEVLKWDGDKWVPASDEGKDGTVISITAGDGLDGGTITETGTIKVKSGGIVVGMLAPDSVTSAKIDDKTIQNADIDDGVIGYAKLNLQDNDIQASKVAGLKGAAFVDVGMDSGMAMQPNDVPSCAADQKLQMSALPVYPRSWSCVGESTGMDDTKLPLAGGTMSGGIDMGGNEVTNLLAPNSATDATTKQYVDDGLADKANTTDLDNYVARAGDNMTGALKLDAQNELRLADSDSNEYVGLRSHANVVGNYVLTLPADTGVADQVLSTDGTGSLSWTTPSTTATPEGSAGGELAGTYPNPTIDDNVIDNANIATGADIDAAKLGTGVVNNTEFDTLDGVTSSIQNQLDGKEDSLPVGGTTGNFLRGDKTWQALSTDDVSEGGNKYFLDSRAQTAVVRQTITSGETSTSPSEDAVKSALDGKANTTDLDSYVLKAGDSMNGNLDMGTSNTVINLAAPSVASDAATKQYVDDGLATKAETTDLNDYVSIAGDTMTGPLKIGAQNELRLADTGSTNYVGLRSSATVTSYTLTLPASTGASDQVLATDGAGNLSWSTPSTTATPEGTAGGELAGTYPNPTIEDGVIDNANIATGANIDAAKLGTGLVDNTEFNTLDGVTSSIQAQLDAKEGTITAGVTGDYWRGDKTWQTLNTDAVVEATNQYFTGARARTAVVDDAIVDATTDRAPSQNAVFDALADKADSTDLGNYVLKAGDTMGGTLNLPADGLVVGTNQLIASGGNVGIGTATPSQRLHISGGSADGSLYVEGYSSTVGAAAATIKQSSGNRPVMLIEHSSTTGSGGGLIINTSGGTGHMLDVRDEGSSKLTIVDGGNVGIGTTSPSVKLDVQDGEIHSNNRYSRTITFTDGWAVGDYVDIVQAQPAASGAASLWEVNLSGTRNSWTEGNTYKIAGTHSADSVWREAGQVSDNTYTGSSKCFTVDYYGNGSSPQFRVRAVKASTDCGSSGSDLNLKFIIYSKSDNRGWTDLTGSGVGATASGFQSMGQSWNLYTGNPRNTDGNLALHADAEGDVGVGTTSPNSKLDVRGSLTHGSGGRGTVTRNVVSYFTSDNNGTEYIHLRLPFNVYESSDMYHITVKGYAYGASKAVDLTFVGYCYVNTNSLQNTQALDPTGSMAPTQYIGSDNNIYLRFKPSSVYYLSFTVDSMYVGNGRVIKPGEITVTKTTATTL